jgi:hypothetical protein
MMAARLGRLADRIGGWKVIIYCLSALTPGARRQLVSNNCYLILAHIKGE